MTNIIAKAIEVIIPIIAVGLIASFWIYVLWYVIRIYTNPLRSGVVVDRTIHISGDSRSRRSSDASNDADTYWISISGWQNGREIMCTFEVSRADFYSCRVGDWYER